ncbi:MAG: type V CRISPR-associated protein C2c8 [Cyanobacteria bacterium SBLK]|nr:type V CRISPR-associated protein C2c8 [Cyanobacteria bacterium SBLK]
MKTLEFKLDLNKHQQATIDSWLDSLRWVWNEGLELLLEYQSFKYYEWLEKQVTKAGGSFEGVERRYLQFSKRSFSATCKIGVGRKGEVRPVQPLPIPRDKPRLKTDSFMGLCGWMTKKHYPDEEALKGVPLYFIRGTLKRLSEAWKAYKDKKQPQRYLPKFKSVRRGDLVTSLYCLDPKAIAIENGLAKCPGTKVLGVLRTINKGLSKRWDETIQPRTLKICKRPSGYYLQLCGDIPEKPLPKSDKACGLDVGLQYIYSDDDGKQIDPPKFYRKSEKRLKRLNRKLSRQQKGSKNSEKTKAKLARTHEKIANQRRLQNHKLSTYLVRKFSGLAVEDIQISNLNRKPKPKKREDGKGYERNGAKAKAGLNKSFNDAGLGQFLEMVEVKAKAGDREFVKVQPAYTSQDCPECGHREKKSLSQRTHRCSNCGYVAPRDVASARVIKSKANFRHEYRDCAREFKPVETLKVGSEKQESCTVHQERRGDVAKTSKPSQYSQLSLNLWGSVEGVSG